MQSDYEIAQLFDRLLPSATVEQVESARWRILDRIHADVAAERPTATTEPLTSSINYGDFNILRVLEGCERHGYAIMAEVEQVTEGATKFGPGTLYTSIQRLLRSGLIEESRSRPDRRLNDEPRRHFRLTGLGQRVLVECSEKHGARLRYAHIFEAAGTI